MKRVPLLSHLLIISLALFWGCNITSDYEETNLPPEIVSSIADQVVFKGDRFAPVYLLEHISDPDGDSQNIEWSFSTSAVLQILTAEDVFLVHPEDPDWSGTEEVTITAKDEAGQIASFGISFTLKNFSGSTAPLGTWIHVKDSLILAYPKSVIVGDPSIDTIYDTTVTAILDTTMILETTEDSVLLWKNASMTTEITSCDYKIAYEKGFLSSVSEEDVEDLLLESVEPLFDSSSINTDLEDSGEVVTVYFANAYTPYVKPVDEYLEVKYGGFIMYAGINMTVRNYAIYKRYSGALPPVTWPQTQLKVD